MSNVKTYSKKSQGNIRLTNNLRVGEFACPDGTDKILIDDKIIQYIQNAVDDNKFSKAIITSGYRTNSYSVKVGGYAGDAHTLGLAADCKFYKTDDTVADHKKVCCYFQDKGVHGIGYIGSAVHIDDKDRIWRGDETNGKTVTDFYSYFRIAKSSTPPTASTSAKRIYLPESATSWRVYPLSVAPIRGNEIAYLHPSKYGGLDYLIEGNPQADVYTISTANFGRVNIYGAPSTGAVIK